MCRLDFRGDGIRRLSAESAEEPNKLLACQSWVTANATCELEFANRPVSIRSPAAFGVRGVPAMRRSLPFLIGCFLALVCFVSLVAGLARFSLSEDIAKGHRLSAESKTRLRNLGYGAYERPSTPADRALVIEALEDADVAVGNDACLAVEKMSAEKAIDAPTMRVALRLLIPKLRSANDDTSEWSSRAVESLALYTRGVEGPLARRLQSEARKMLEDQDPEMRRRGANLSARLLPRLQRNDFEELVRALLVACRRPVHAFNAESAKKRGKLFADGDVRAAEMAVVALGAASPLIDDKSLASEAAVELLKGSKRAWLSVRCFGLESIVGLAHLAKRVDGPLREEIVKWVIVAVANPTGTYSRTSGLPSPEHHYGADALTVLAPILDRKAVEAAAKAIPSSAITSESSLLWVSPSDYTSMYGPALQALADRRQELERGKPDHDRRR
jgi:hypothetical protein